MKKLSFLLAICICACLFCGCGEPDETTSDVSPENTSSVALTENSEADTKSGNSSAVDVDLTQMNSTMVYSQVYDIVSKPDKYLGKKIKMKGNVGIYHDEATDIYYYACIIPDATACCQQGIEFLLDGEPSRDKYPAQGSEITIEGNFETYKEGEQQYPRLKNAVLL
ncbi:MAG: hypothetical protein KBS41_05355 [Oscillospiraceae bacterium]|nr:hypothetical protein [Candidatus Equicaccousia limihippi]